MTQIEKMLRSKMLRMHKKGKHLCSDFFTDLPEFVFSNQKMEY